MALELADWEKALLEDSGFTVDAAGSLTEQTAKDQAWMTYRTTQIGAQTKAVETLDNLLKTVVKPVYDMSGPEAAKQVLLDVAPDIVQNFGGLSAAAAGDYVNAMFVASGLPATATVADAVPVEQIKASLQAQLGPLFTGDFDTLTTKLSGTVGRLAAKPGHDTVVQSAIHSSAKPKWARIPTSKKPCTFCRMLAGRGAVYRSKDRAGGDPSHKFHDHCHCRTVLILNDGDWPAGYDPSVFEQEYLDAHEPGMTMKQTLQAMEANANAKIAKAAAEAAAKQAEEAAKIAEETAAKAKIAQLDSAVKEQIKVVNQAKKMVANSVGLSSAPMYKEQLDAEMAKLKELRMQLTAAKKHPAVAAEFAAKKSPAKPKAKLPEPQTVAEAQFQVAELQKKVNSFRKAHGLPNLGVANTEGVKLTPAEQVKLKNLEDKLNAAKSKMVALKKAAAPAADPMAAGKLAQLEHDLAVAKLKVPKFAGPAQKKAQVTVDKIQARIDQLKKTTIPPGKPPIVQGSVFKSTAKTKLPAGAEKKVLQDQLHVKETGYKNAMDWVAYYANKGDVGGTEHAFQNATKFAVERNQILAKLGLPTKPMPAKPSILTKKPPTKPSSPFALASAQADYAAAAKKQEEIFKAWMGTATGSPKAAKLEAEMNDIIAKKKVLKEKVESLGGTVTAKADLSAKSVAPQPDKPKSNIFQLPPGSKVQPMVKGSVLEEHEAASFISGRFKPRDRSDYKGDREVNALRAYQGTAYRRWNADLRNGTPLSHMEDDVKHLADLFKSQPTLGKPMQLYRGMPATAELLDPERMIGRTWSDAGFLSTSLKKSVSDGFKSGDSMRDTVMWRITAPSNAKAIPVETVLNGQNPLNYEGEILFPPGTKLRVIRAEVREKQGYGGRITRSIYYDAEVVVE